MSAASSERPTNTSSPSPSSSSSSSSSSDKVCGVLCLFDRFFFSWHNRFGANRMRLSKSYPLPPQPPTVANRRLPVRRCRRHLRRYQRRRQRALLQRLRHRRHRRCHRRRRRCRRRHRRRRRKAVSSTRAACCRALSRVRVRRPIAKTRTARSTIACHRFTDFHIFAELFPFAKGRENRQANEGVGAHSRCECRRFVC
jgi:hypothetical protein